MVSSQVIDLAKKVSCDLDMRKRNGNTNNNYNLPLPLAVVRKRILVT